MFKYTKRLLFDIRFWCQECKIRLAAEFEAAHHIGSSGKTYTTAWAWKFNSLQFEYRQSHPFE